jgi:cation transport regulator ChaC
MGLHFAYGSNMDRAGMAARCPAARAVGRATLEGWRFLINRDGYATITRSAGAIVHGVLWRLTARDRAALDAYESLSAGLYLVRTLPVRAGTGRVPALVYLGRSRVPGPAKPGYLDAVLRAARDWNLPESYVRSIARSAAFRDTRSAG